MRERVGVMGEKYGEGVDGVCALSTIVSSASLL